jgi:hypothetical protein
VVQQRLYQLLEGSHATKTRKRANTLMRKMKSVLVCLGLALVPVLFTGCASVACGNRQEVALYSKPLAADVVIYNNHGDVVYRGKTPCVATLVRTAPESGRANYIVLMKKEGYENAQVPLKSRLNNAGVAGAFAGGLLLDSEGGGSWTLCPDASAPQLRESPDVLRPDGVCLVLPQNLVAPVTAKVQTASK